jgi:hypothetical protein
LHQRAPLILPYGEAFVNTCAEILHNCALCSDSQRPG